MTTSATGFRAFGLDHLIALIALPLLGVLTAWFARKLSASGQRWMGRFMGLALLGYAVTAYLRRGLTTGLRWEDGLPLHVCDWVLIACLIALFRPGVFAFEIAYCWGLTLTLPAIFTPDLQEGFPALAFFQFFWGHGGIVLSIVFLIAGAGLRPRKGSALRACAALAVYTVVVGAIDWLSGWNYGYLRHRPFQPSLLDHLGSWPWYILTTYLIAAINFWALGLPWKWIGRAGQRQRPPTSL